MAGQRVRGQECSITMTVDNAPQASFNAVRSFDFSYELELQQEGYIGETTDRYDTIFKGIKGNVELHIEGPEVFDMISSIVDKARRRVPGTRLNLKGTLNLPNGKRARAVFRDVEFGTIPVKAGSRTDYITVSVPWGCSEAVVLAA